eukprot:GHVT01089297.1.p2 GENE.GHVT01089297.1~~GHVT01089297.1.p2  ORF type:complete len:162 (-),score=54.66 GHVT01089297.1:557-1042(-)
MERLMNESILENIRLRTDLVTLGADFKRLLEGNGSASAAAAPPPAPVPAGGLVGSHAGATFASSSAAGGAPAPLIASKAAVEAAVDAPNGTTGAAGVSNVGTAASSSDSAFDQFMLECEDGSVRSLGPESSSSSLCSEVVHFDATSDSFPDEPDDSSPLPA